MHGTWLYMHAAAGIRDERSAAVDSLMAGWPYGPQQPHQERPESLLPTRSSVRPQPPAWTNQIFDPETRL